MDDAFDGDASGFAEYINGEGVRCERGERNPGEEESYLFLPSRPNDRYSGIIRSGDSNIMVINRIPYHDEDTKNSYDSLRIEFGVNGTEPVEFPDSVERFTDHVNIVSRVTDVVLTDLIDRVISPEVKEEYRKMELPFHTGQTF